MREHSLFLKKKWFSIVEFKIQGQRKVLGDKTGEVAGVRAWWASLTHMANWAFTVC